MTMVVEYAFAFGDIVYLKTDTEQYPRIVTGFKLRPGGNIVYILSSAEEESVHYDIEISVEKTILLTL